MTTIPASVIVAVTPNVLAAGGSALDLNGLLLTTSIRPPIGTVPSFPSAQSVSDYFGGASTEAALAAIYFAGFDNSSVKPGALLMAQYPVDAVSAYLRGGDFSETTIAELQALSGTLNVTIDGDLETASISLAAATSFSGAAKLLQAGLGISGPQTASVTGSIAGTTLTVSAVTSGQLSVGDVVSGTGVSASTRIAGLLTGTGGVGTYEVDTTQTALSQTLTINAPGVYYDSVSGAFVIQSGTTGDDSTITFGSGALGISLLLTSATGATLSQGSDAAVPAAFMNGVIAVTQNWAAFTTAFNPDDDDETAERLALSDWVSSKDDRYAYAAWDTDAAPTVSNDAAASLGRLVEDAQNSGTIVIWAADDDEGPKKGAFVLGVAASINFAETNGRTTFKFRKQAGLVADVTDETIYSNLLANGYNFYGAFGTANDEFVFWVDGSISGDFLWADSYFNELWMNNAFQLALVVLLTTASSVPYNVAGRAMIEQSLADPINAALNFGAIRAGIALSASQAAEVNSDAGRRISDTLTQVGYYLQVLDASAEVRQARGSPPCKFWYMDGQSVQQIDLTSIAVL